jgi:hypothetical protein
MWKMEGVARRFKTAQYIYIYIYMAAFDSLVITDWYTNELITEVSADYCPVISNICFQHV